MSFGLVVILVYFGAIVDGVQFEIIERFIKIIYLLFCFQTYIDQYNFSIILI